MVTMTLSSLAQATQLFAPLSPQPLTKGQRWPFSNVRLKTTLEATADTPPVLFGSRTTVCKTLQPSWTSTPRKSKTRISAYTQRMIFTTTCTASRTIDVTPTWSKCWYTEPANTPMDA